MKEIAFYSAVFRDVVIVYTDGTEELMCTCEGGPNQSAEDHAEEMARNLNVKFGH